MLFGLLTAAAWAHGPDPVPLSIASSDDAGPVHVALTEGMAVRDGAQWRFICPARWGSLPEAPTSAVPGADDATVVPGEDDVYHLTTDSLGTPLGVAELEAVDLAGWATSPAGTSWALRFADGGKEVWRLDEPALVATVDGAWAGISASDDTLWLAGLLDGDLVVAELDPSGKERTRTVWAEDQSGYTADARAAHDLYVVERASGAHALYRRGNPAREHLATGADEVIGPVPHPDGVDLVVVDTILSIIGTGGLVPVADAPPITCLQRRGSAVYACVDTEIFPVAADGSLDESVFELVLIGPSYEGLSTEAQATCEFEWARIADDLGIDPYPDTGDTGADDSAGESGTGEDTGVPPSEGCGCDTLPARTGAGLLGLILIVLRGRRETRAAPPRSPTAGTPRGVGRR